MPGFKPGSIENFNSEQLYNNYDKDRYEYKSMPRGSAAKNSLVRHNIQNPAGHFIFPRRQRFNEDIDNEIQS